MIINGTDYSLPFFALLSVLALFILQFFLLYSPRLRFLRNLPWIWVAGVMVLAVVTLFGDTGGWIDLRSFFCGILLGYAAICAAGIGLAYLLHKLIKR